MVSSYHTRSLIPSKEFASIQSVRQGIAEIQINSVRGYDKGGNTFDPDAYMVCTFYMAETEAFVCKEGVFRWAHNFQINSKSPLLFARPLKKLFQIKPSLSLKGLKLKWVSLPLNSKRMLVSIWMENT